jgi:hypothetical protein
LPFVAGYLAVLDTIRTFLARHLFSPLQGITAGTFWRLLVRHRFAVHPSYWPRGALLTLCSVENSAFACWEEWRYGRKIDGTQIQPPVFILGHYRSGTTHLHNLLSHDQQFSYPTLLQTVYPQTFLTTGAMISPFMAIFLPRQRPLDNVAVGPEEPSEDEFALCAATALSPYMAWVFPRTGAGDDQYLTLRNVPGDELAQWKAALTRFLKKLTLVVDKPLLLKSPPHTARIGLLLEMFPKARFVHIHRHPYAVFASMRHLLRTGPPALQLQLPTMDDPDSWIINTYKTIYDPYFEERSLIPAGQFCEVGYEELEREPIRVVGSIYESLGLTGFESMQGSLQKYLASLAGYRKNEYPDLPEPLRERIACEWQRSFDEWGYSR